MIKTVPPGIFRLRSFTALTIAGQGDSQSSTSRVCEILGPHDPTQPHRFPMVLLEQRLSGKIVRTHRIHDTAQGRLTRDLTKGRIALKAQISPHSPHPLHCSSSTIGTGTVTLAEPSSTGLRNKWALGSSTSQSMKQTDSVSARVRAKFTATVVLPVPPFPLAIDMIMRHPHL